MLTAGSSWQRTGDMESRSLIWKVDKKKTLEGKSFQTLKISFVGAYNPSLSSETD